jgi:signal transduction histidine kinase
MSERGFVGLLRSKCCTNSTLSTPSKHSSLLFWIMVPITIAILLIIVGSLQVQWSNEIKQAAEYRAGTDLESTMMKWHLDFYSEISAVCTALQIGPDSGARDSHQDYIQRYTRWHRAASNDDSVEDIYSNPDLVRDIFIWESSAGEHARLLRVNPDTGTIEKSVPPEDLGSLLLYLRQRSSNLRVALRAWESDDTRNAGGPNSKRFLRAHNLRGDAVAGWQFDAGTPALVHPIFAREGLGVLPAEDSRRDQPVDWVVAVLNLETIEKQILPRLARRYFQRGHESDYEVAVISGDKAPRLLYSSDPNFVAEDVRTSDAVMNIFASPLEGAAVPLLQIKRDEESLKEEDWLRFASPVWFPVIQHTLKNGPWLLVLKSRTGAIFATVQRGWWIHLFTGGVVLLLLAASIVLLVIASRRAETLANLQMDFVTSVSHELRTPLAAILSAGQNISDGYASDLKLYGGLITAQARQEIELVDQILLFASSKNGAKNYFLQRIEVKNVLDHVRRDTIAVLEQSGFAVQIDVAPSLPPIVGDLRFVSRCLQNLIGNAAKYSGPSRWIGVSADLEEVEGLGERVRISVADRGMGISPLDQQRIFEPFYRSPQVLATQIHGTGLGLSVTKYLVDAMGGGVSVISEPGLGSIFSLHFQVARALDSEMVA